MSSRMLLIDSVNYDLEILTGEDSFSEDRNPEYKGRLRFKGKFQEAERVNRNKRKYPKSVLEREVARLQEAIKEHGLIGELDHPSDSVIHFENASHAITDLKMEGNIVVGEGVILPTPAGQILENLVKCGVRFGISSRGVGSGSVDKDGVLIIGEDYRLITFDTVADPSTLEAFPEVMAQQGKVQTDTSTAPTSEEHTENNGNNADSRVNSLDENTRVKLLTAWLVESIRSAGK